MENCKKDLEDYILKLKIPPITKASSPIEATDNLGNVGSSESPSTGTVRLQGTKSPESDNSDNSANSSNTVRLKPPSPETSSSVVKVGFFAPENTIPIPQVSEVHLEPTPTALVK